MPLDDTDRLRDIIEESLAWFPHVWVGDTMVYISKCHPDTTGRNYKIDTEGKHLHTRRICVTDVNRDSMA